MAVDTGPNNQDIWLKEKLEGSPMKKPILNQVTEGLTIELFPISFHSFIILDI